MYRRRARAIMNIVFSDELKAQIAAIANLPQQLADHAKILGEQISSSLLKWEAETAVVAREFQSQVAATRRHFAELPTRLQEAVLTLAANGWYFDVNMPLSALWALEGMLAGGDVVAADEALAEYFEGEVVNIEARLIDLFPHRGALIRSAFDAHRRQEYELSIPVVLAQVDGICKEAIDNYFFIKERRRPGSESRPGTAVYVDAVINDTFKAALLSPLARTFPISASERERDEGFNGLNRHMVMHGESLDYGTKINSLKAISLLNYVASAVKE
jgi:hypothetical protein